MKRVNLFLILLIASITALIAATAIGFALFSSTDHNPYDWMSQMWNYNSGGMGGMMGHTQTQQTTATTWLPIFGILFAVLIVIIITGVLGVSYYLVYPQIRIGALQPAVTLTQPSGNTVSAYESVSKTLTDDERKVIEVLKAHEGKYLQKYVKSETGLSRLRTHRIIARLSERGIVTLEKTGNTNQVYLANWLSQEQ
jgi:uncharacterized membrane protein